MRSACAQGGSRWSAVARRFRGLAGFALPRSLVFDTCFVLPACGMTARWPARKFDDVDGPALLGVPSVNDQNGPCPTKKETRGVGTRFDVVVMGMGPVGEWQRLVVSTDVTGAHPPTERASPERSFREQRRSPDRQGTLQAFKAPCPTGRALCIDATS